MRSVIFATCRVALLTVFTLSLAVSHLKAQPAKLTGHLLPIIDPDINGFYDYLPHNYQHDVQEKYPLLIFFHGYGDSGSLIDSLTLKNVLNAGTPKLLRDGAFPDSFFVRGKWHKFIVLVPQIKLGLFAPNNTSLVKPSTVDALLDYAVKNYRVDVSKIYLSGLSMGGGVASDYVSSSAAAAKRIAGVAIAAAASNVSESGADIIAAANLPLVATHNTVDDLIPYGRTVSMMAKIRNSLRKQNKNENPTTTRAIYWETAGEGNFLGEDNHNSWSRTFVDLKQGSSKGGNLADTMGATVYEWLLTYSRTADGALPLVWESFDLSERSGSVNVQWATSRELSTDYFGVEKSTDGIQWQEISRVTAKNQSDIRLTYAHTDANYSGFTTYYRIRQVDFDGRFTYSVIKSIGASSLAQGKAYPNPFSDKITLTIPATNVPGILRIRILNLKGELIKSAQVKAESSRSINFNFQGLQSLSAGNYVVVVENGDNKVILREKIIRK